MSAANNGEPAFPSNEKHGNGLHFASHAGMSLRDWFAGQALAGLFSRSLYLSAEQHAREAYAAADAMIEERVK